MKYIAYIINLVIQAFFIEIGLASDPKNENQYKEVHELLLLYNRYQDEETVEEALKMQDKIIVEQQKVIILVDISENTDLDANIDLANEKLEDICIEICHSEKKHEDFYKLTQQFYDLITQSLTLICNMPI